MTCLAETDDRNLRNRAIVKLLVGFIGVCLTIVGGFMVVQWEQSLAYESQFWEVVCHYGCRLLLIVASLVAWFWTQKMIASRPTATAEIRDGVHELTVPILCALKKRPRLADGILIASSACIDAFGVFLILATVFGTSLRPFAALLIVFSLRQLCQAVSALPVPKGMIWRDPGFPSLLVTYDVGNDFFFSGHTAIAVLGTLVLFSINPVLGIIGGIIALGEMAVVLVLRAHYTMDVFAAILAAVCAYSLAGVLLA